MASVDAIAMLRSIIAGDAVDADAVAWVRDGMQRWLLQGGSISVPAALGLNPKPLSVRKALRNSWLCEAALHLDGSAWSRATALQRAIARFNYRWPRLRHLAAPPESLAPIDRALFLAFKVCADMPGSVQGVRDAIGAVAAHIEPSEVIEKLGCGEISMSSPSLHDDRHALSDGIRR